jgi:ABC-type nitrate/sulfonate/bicarbonate transport system permease component
VINTYAGVRGTDPILVKTAQSLGAGPWQLIRKVVLPSALPTILAGYRLGTGIALLLVVSAEMINATSGIGFLILNSGDLMLTGKLMVGLVILSVLGLVSTWGLRALEAWLIRGRRTAEDRPGRSGLVPAVLVSVGRPVALLPEAVRASAMRNAAIRRDPR